MPMTKLAIRAGINREKSQTLNEGGWSDASLVRFRDGLPQKWLGWQKALTTAFTGMTRQLIAWQQLNGVTNIGAFTNTNWYIVQGGTQSDITPVDITGTEANNPFTTASGSTLVNVFHPGHTRGVGDSVAWSGATTFNNVTMNGTFTVAAIVDNNNYKVTSATTPNATGSGGGAAVAYTYFLNVGPADAIFGPGWGAGTWGGPSPENRTWGTAASTTIKSQSPRIVTADNFGEDLILCVRDGGIYRWVASTGTTTRAAKVTNAPASAKSIIIGQPERHVIALGAESGGTLDPLLVRWSDVENYTGAGSWTATATNSAGSFRLLGGTKIVHGKRTQGGILVLTDDLAYLMQFVNLPYVYAFRPQGGGSGLIAVNAIMDINGTSYWWGPSGFFSWRGAIRKLSSSLHVDVFGSGANGLNRAQQEKVFCGHNSSENELLWFYPSNGGTGECDRFIAYNYQDEVWFWGALPRTAWLDRGFLPNPIAMSSSGSLYFHEIGVDDDGSGMSAFLESGYIDIGDGEEFILIQRFIPDFQSFVGQLQITFKAQEYPNGPVFTRGPYTVLPGTKFVRSPIRGRQVAIRITSSNVGDWWRLGATRFITQEDGRK
jgi:hypothetical protein